MNRKNIILLYLFLATAEKDFTAKEIEKILLQIKSRPDYEERETETLWNEASEIMRQNKPKEWEGFLSKLLTSSYLSEVDLKQIYKSMEEIIESDGIVTMHELTQYQKAKHILMFSTFLSSQARA